MRCALLLLPISLLVSGCSSSQDAQFDQTQFREQQRMFDQAMLRAQQRSHAVAQPVQSAASPPQASLPQAVASLGVWYSPPMLWWSSPVIVMPAPSGEPRDREVPALAERYWVPTPAAPLPPAEALPLPAPRPLPPAQQVYQPVYILGRTYYAPPYGWYGDGHRRAHTSGRYGASGRPYGRAPISSYRPYHEFRHRDDRRDDRGEDRPRDRREDVLATPPLRQDLPGDRPAGPIQRRRAQPDPIRLPREAPAAPRPVLRQDRPDDRPAGPVQPASPAPAPPNAKPALTLDKPGAATGPRR